jgi:hydroxyacylglutathione hydrolase
MEITSIPLNYFFGVNCYLIKSGESYFLIDTGITKTRDQLEQAIKDAGCKPRGLKLIIITHGHMDHIGNAVYLRDKYGAKIAMHMGDAKMVESGDMFINTEGGALIAIIGIFSKLFGLAGPKFTPDILLEDNQSLKEYGLDATVIHNPGHSEGSISIYTANKNLFCGDLFNNDKKPVKASIIKNAEKLDASVEKIKTLDTKTIYPGHGKPFTTDQLE